VLPRIIGRDCAARALPGLPECIVSTVIGSATLNGNADGVGLTGTARFSSNVGFISFSKLEPAVTTVIIADTGSNRIRNVEVRMPTSSSVSSASYSTANLVDVLTYKPILAGFNDGKVYPYTFNFTVQSKTTCAFGYTDYRFDRSYTTQVPVQFVTAAGQGQATGTCGYADGVSASLGVSSSQLTDPRSACGPISLPASLCRPILNNRQTTTGCFYIVDGIRIRRVVGESKLPQRHTKHNQ